MGIPRLGGVIRLFGGIGGCPAWGRIKEKAMLVDRPRGPIVTLENGEDVLISYRWGSNDNPLPVGAHVMIKNPVGENLVIGEVEGPFDDLEQVEALGIQAANYWFSQRDV